MRGEFQKVSRAYALIVAATGSRYTAVIVQALDYLVRPTTC